MESRAGAARAGRLLCTHIVQRDADLALCVGRVEEVHDVCLHRAQAAVRVVAACGRARIESGRVGGGRRRHRR